MLADHSGKYDVKLVELDRNRKAKSTAPPSKWDDQTNDETAQNQNEQNQTQHFRCLLIVSAKNSIKLVECKVANKGQMIQAKVHVRYFTA